MRTARRDATSGPGDVTSQWVLVTLNLKVWKSAVLCSTLTTATFTPVDRARLNPRGDLTDHDATGIHPGEAMRNALIAVLVLVAGFLADRVVRIEN